MIISLKTITLFNFKSFRGEVIIGPIQPFTAIIGPNGSGKSNLVDAIRFVLGEKSSALRVKRLNELVYGAIFGKPTTEDTYVTMILTMDDEERSFTRMIHGGSSQYKIINEIVSYDFYTSELRKLGLDVNLSNFVVPQNYIESIAMKTPKEQTAMLEQISGSGVHKEDYDRLKVKLQEAENEVQFVRQMRKQLLLQKKYAIEEETEAKKYSQLREQYIQEKTRFQLFRLLLVKKTFEMLQDEEKKIKSQIDEHLLNKSNTMNLLKDKELQIKQLSNFLEDVELNILKLENVIQKKRIEYVAIEGTISHWQNKCDCAHVSLDNANKTYHANKKNIQELESELEKISLEVVKLRERKSEENIELSNSQVERYMNLKNKAENRAKDVVMKINDLMRDQQINRDKLNNYNRCKQELEDKTKQITLMKENLEERSKKLRDLNVESKAAITQMIIKRQKISEQIAEIKIKSTSLENDMIKISEELCQSDIDNYMVSHQMKKAEIIKMLKQLFSGVYERLSNLCKPIHSRYNIAVIKVFKKHLDSIVVDSVDTAKQCIQFLKVQRLDVETFLPLDSIKTVTLKERLRSIQELANVKLLYDVLDISYVQISKAVLFVTENTLVCETAEDARKMAYEIGHRYYDCVSLDGCFYRKSGLISGGQADLTVKAKQWGIQQVSILRERKAQLIQELRDLPVISQMQSELNVTDIQIKGISLKNNYMEKDMKDTEDKIPKAYQELNIIDTELSKLNRIILKIQYDMQEKDEEIKNLKRHISVIEDKIFANFCKDINVPNISYYEETNLRMHQEQKRRQLELEEQYDRIENQLCFERECDATSKISKWKLVMQQAIAQLNDMREKENLIKIDIEGKEMKLLQLNNKYVDVKKNLENIQIDLTQSKLQIDIIEKYYVNSRRAHILLQKEQQQKQTELNTILKECKIEDINIPMLPVAQRSHDESRDFSSTSRSGSNLIGSEFNTESLSDWEILTSIKIDFSRFTDDIHNKTENELHDIVIQVHEKLKEIQNELKIVEKPNFKAQEKIDLIAQQIREASAKFQELRKKSNDIKTQFETVKTKRFKLFSDCLERIAAEIDSIYKDLVNDKSAQAFIIPENPEEPYIGAINYSCIAPSKRFQPMQYLSGGEKSLASLALLFAIQRFKSTPFFIMDEGDTALDKTNIKNIIRFIQLQTNAMQFIVITFQKLLQFNTDALIGITTDPDAECLESNIFAISLSRYKA